MRTSAGERRSVFSHTILFYIDPLVEWGQPYRRLWWVCNAIAMMHRLEPDRSLWSGHFRILTSAFLADQARRPLTGPYAGPVRGIEDPFRMPDGVLVGLARDDARIPFDSDVGPAAWYHGEDTRADRTAAADVVRQRVGDFRPDIVVTFAVAPFLSTAYPDALVIDHESGMFTNAPFPPSFILDPCGKYRFSFLRRFTGELMRRPLTDGDRDRLARLRRHYLDEILIPRSPFGGLKEEVRANFDSIWLVPSHLPGNALAARLPYRDYLDYLFWIIDEVGPRTGIIVTQHPFFETVLSPETEDYLQATFANYIPVANEWVVSCSAHFLLDVADGIIGLDSSATQHGLLWRRKMVTLVDNQFRGFAHATTLRDLADVARLPWDDGREALLHWMLTHYLVPRWRYEDPVFLAEFLERSLVRWRHVGVNAEFFDPLGSPDTIFDDWIDAADPDVPQSRLLDMRYVAAGRLGPMYHALAHECAHHRHRADWFETRLVPELNRLRTESMRAHLLAPGSPLRVSPFAGTGPAAPGAPAAVSRDQAAVADWRRLAEDPWDAERCAIYAARLTALREEAEAAAVLVWAALQKPAPATADRIRGLLATGPALAEAWFIALATVSAGRSRRTEAYLSEADAAAPEIDRVVSALRRDGAAEWPGLYAAEPRLADLLATLPEGAAGDRNGRFNSNSVEEPDASSRPLSAPGPLLEAVARAFASDVRQGAAAHGPDTGQRWERSPWDRVLVAVRLTDRADGHDFCAEVIPGAHVPTQIKGPEILSRMSGRPAPVPIPTACPVHLDTRRAGDAVLVLDAALHRWRDLGDTMVLVLTPDTLRNRGLAAVLGDRSPL